MTRKDHLVQLVAGLIADPNRSDSVAGHVNEAMLFLAEIERACPDPAADAPLTLLMQERAAERERCVAELTRVYVELGVLNGAQATSHELLQSGIAAIRGAK